MGGIHKKSFSRLTGVTAETRIAKTPMKYHVWPKAKRKVSMPLSHHFLFLRAILPVFAADVAGFDLIDEDAFPIFETVERDRSETIASVEEMVMAHFTFRRFIAHEDHVFLQADDIGDHL